MGTYNSYMDATYIYVTFVLFTRDWEGWDWRGQIFGGEMEDNRHSPRLDGLRGAGLLRTQITQITQITREQSERSRMGIYKSYMDATYIYVTFVLFT